MPYQSFLFVTLPLFGVNAQRIGAVMIKRTFHQRLIFFSISSSEHAVVPNLEPHQNFSKQQKRGKQAHDPQNYQRNVDIHQNFTVIAVNETSLQIILSGVLSAYAIKRLQAIISAPPKVEPFPQRKSSCQ